MRSDIPNTYRDASAAAILCSALLELAKYSNKTRQKEYMEVAIIILKNLSSFYRAIEGTNGGFILKHGVGHLPAKSEVDVPLTYGDYYFIEALICYKNWYLK